MKLRDLVEYVPARAFEAGLGSFPAPVADRLGFGAGDAARRIGVRRELVERQIGEAFPERSEDWIRETTRACYRHFGREIAAIARLGRTGAARLFRGVKLGEQTVAWHNEVTQGKGSIIVTGHVGNWEVAGALLAAAGLSMAAVVKRQRNPAFDERLLETRRRVGIEPIYMQDANTPWGSSRSTCRTRIPGFRRRFAKGRPWPWSRTRTRAGAGSSCRFWAGRPRRSAVPPDSRSRRTFRYSSAQPYGWTRGLSQNVPLFFGAAVRVDSGYGSVLELVDVPPPGDDQEVEFTRSWVAHLEALIRLHPEQYFWFHRRWKTRPAGTTAPEGR